MVKRFSIPARISVGAVLWGVLLVLVWAIHPVESAAEYAPVDDPSPAEQASIDEVLDDFDGARPALFNRVQCSSNPLQAATGDRATSSAPALPDGFRYVDPLCSSAYSAASAAVWINLVVLGAIVALCVAIHLGLRRREPDPTGTAAISEAEAVVVRS